MVFFILRRSHNLKSILTCDRALPFCSFGLQFLLWNFCWAITELWYFILFLNQSFNSGQVAVLGKERKEASLSCHGLFLRVLIDKGTLYRWLKEFPLYSKSVISLSLFACRWQAFASFRASFSPASGTSVIFIHSNWSKPVNYSHLQHFFSQTNLPLSQQRCWKLCELQAVSHVYWWTDIWEMTKEKKMFLLFSSFLLQLNHPSQVLPSTQSSVSEGKAFGRGTCSNWIGLDKPAQQSYIPWGVSSIK